MATIGIGIIGTGSIVNTYVKCVKEIEGAELIALYTTTPERINEVEALFDVPVLTDLEEFLSHPELHLVCICNKSGLHGDSAITAARNGKHILCEKPLEVTTKKIDQIIKVCAENDTVLGCVLQNRCSEAYTAVEDVVRSGVLGKLLLGNAHINWYRSPEYYSANPWRGTKEFDGGAAFMNQGIHTIDLLLNLMGEVISVFGNMKTLVHAIECEDVGTGIINFEKGAIGTITASTALFPGYPERLEIFGQHGSIFMEGGEITQWNVPGIPPPEFTNEQAQVSGAANPADIGHLNHKRVLQDMLTALKEKGQPMVNAQEARKAVAVITALYRSSEKGKLVFL